MKLQKILMTCLLVAVVALVGIFVLPTDAQAATEGYYTYEVSGGKATITGCDTSISGDVTIPSTLGGYPVIGIGSYAFYQCDNLTSIAIPEGATFIYGSAFEDCSSLMSITIPEGVTFIGGSAFWDCSSLESITIPSGVTNISSGAFYRCTSLTSITLPDSVTAIGDSAFAGCTSLVSIALPDSVTAIGNSAFSYCSSLKNITLPDSVTSIGNYAFYYCSSLKSITIPEGVTSIGGSVFLFCSSLTSVTIPDSVTSIGYSAFEYCGSIKDVYYASDSTKWSKISVGYHNSSLLNAKIHYNHIHDYSLLPPVTVAATCTQDGYVEYTCALGETYRETLPALGHLKGADGVVIGPICAEQGYTLSTCSRCGEQSKTDYVPALGHDFRGKQTVVEPTCTEQGYTLVQCTRCEETEKRSFTDSLGHSMVAIPAVEPTCTEQGMTAGTGCARCGLVGVAQTPIAALGHTVENGVCTVCGSENISDYTGDGDVTDSDAIYLLRHILFPDSFPISGNADVNGDGELTDADAIYLLRHTLFPDYYPLYPKKKEA